MTTLSTKRPSAVLCLFALLFALALPLAAATIEDDAVTLKGMLSRNEAGRFALVEEESGNSILLESDDPQQLADNEGKQVTVTGRFSASRETFFVSSVTPEPTETPIPPAT